MSFNRRLFKSLFIIIFFAAQRNILPQISPGDLTTAHSNLEGISNCTKCHVLGKQLYNSKCFDCHKEIVELINLRQGYHSSSDVKDKDCWSCHSEHNGRDFRIINFDPQGFNHNKTGFELTGSHSKLECSSCHTDKFITNKDFKKRSGTYLGLEKNCSSCHKDFHQGTLGNNCSACHNTEKFKPAVGFNHDKTDFKLIGSHKVVECVKCHPIEEKNNEKFQKFKGVLFSSCASCHKDVHNGKFGENCSRCHNENSFKILNKNSSFDHDKTRFPLKGAHNNVKCSDCHGSNLLSKPKFAKCTNCHKDAHSGEFTVNKILRDCKDCHSVESFKVTSFTIMDHSKLKFELTGAHLAVPCQSCHYKDGVKQWHFINIGLNCIDCHKNVHGFEIREKFMKNNDCTSCHLTEDWAKISFNHDLTNFKLEGKHQTIKCKDCHEFKTALGKIDFKFVSLKSDCQACHKDIHFGQFNSKQSGINSVCEDCHGFNNWKPGKFDHEKTAFPLKGAHEKLLCSSCHKKVTENGNEFIKYKLKDFKCASCHS